MGNIKPIETYYNGYRFRSRIEARWAVFFDLLGIPYHYELQGFVVRGRPYLPDFIIYPNNNGPYVEIKGFTPKQVEIETAEALSVESRKVVILFVGDPFGIAEKYEFIPSEWNEFINPEQLYEWERHSIGLDLGIARRWMERIVHVDENGFVYGHYAEPVTDWEYVGCVDEGGNASGGIWFPTSKPANNPPDIRDTLHYAQIRARQARFEHGETPRKQRLI